MSENMETQHNFILFQLGGTTYGVRSTAVQRIEMVEQVTPVPNAPPYVEGVILSGGRVIPAMNLRMRFGFEKAPYDVRTRLIIVRSGERTVGLIVDRAREFVALPPQGILPPPEMVADHEGKYLEGIVQYGGRLVLLLDVEALLNLEDVAQVH